MKENNRHFKNEYFSLGFFRGSIVRLSNSLLVSCDFHCLACLSKNKNKKIKKKSTDWNPAQVKCLGVYAIVEWVTNIF